MKITDILKYIFPIFCLLVMMTSAFAGAIYFPLPINGKLIGPNIASLPIEVTNLRTGKILTTYTTSSGEYLVDWANSDDDGGAIVKYFSGDQFKVVILSCASDLQCQKTLTYTGQNEVFTVFDITGVPITCPSVPVCPRQKDQDCNCVSRRVYVNDCDSSEELECPIPEAIKDCAEIESCEEVFCPATKDSEVCPDETQRNETISWIIGGLSSIMFAIAGLVLGGFKWFPGMKGLSKYYTKKGLNLIKEGKFTDAKKELDRSFNMMKTSVEKAKSGEYDDEDE